MTPLFTASPQHQKVWGVTEAIALTPEAVAQAIWNLIQKSEHPGATVYGISKIPGGRKVQIP